jgi:hypothetical protein
MPEIHNIKAIGPLVLTESSANDHAISRGEIEQAVGLAPLYITDITPSSAGIVANKAFAASQPADKFLSSAIADTQNVRVHVLARGGMYTPPNIEVAGVAVSNWSAVSDVFFEGYVDLTVAETGTITAVNTAIGTSYSVNLTLLLTGPTINLLTIGSLPAGQTEVKSGDVITFTGTVSNDAETMQLVSGGAAGSGNVTNIGDVDTGGEGYRTFSGTFTVSSSNGTLGISVRAANFLGTYGDTANSVNTIVVNQTAPTIGTISVAYPNGQLALKDGESATVSATVNGADSVAYAYTGGDDVTITDPTVYAVSKTVTLNIGTYEATANYTITATKASNGAVTTKSGSIKIATSAMSAAVSIAGNPTRLRTSPAGETYTLVVTPDQIIDGDPNVTLAVGTWQNAWTFSGGAFRRDFMVSDATARGDHSVTGTILNAAGVETVISDSFNVGGLVERTITFDAYARYMAIGANVVDFSKTRARYAGTDSDLVRRADTVDVQGAFTISDGAGVYSATGDHLFLNDAAYAGANTSGTLQVLFEELM